MNDLCAFVGCGNMGGALVRAAAKSSFGPERIGVLDHHPDKTEALCRETGCHGVNAEEAVSARFLFLGMKPQAFAKAAAELRPLLEGKSPVLVSMLGGTPIARVKELLGELPVIRIMPNLPVAVGAGMTLWCAEGVSEEDLRDFFTLMQPSGEWMELPEKLIDAGSSVSGCGPAWAAMFCEALADGGVRCGLKRADALRLAEQMLLGTGAYLLVTGKHPGVLKDEVSSPGGTTIEGVLALEQGAFRGAVSEAVIRACEKNGRLG